MLWREGNPGPEGVCGFCLPKRQVQRDERPSLFFLLICSRPIQVAESSLAMTVLAVGTGFQLCVPHEGVSWNYWFVYHL